MEEDIIKQRVQAWIVTGSVLILCGKFLAFYLTNSVGILTDAMESIVNVTAGFISLYSLRIAARPKDSTHPFGHGKVELISASLEGLLIIVAGGMIVFEGVRRLFEPAEIGRLDIGIIVVTAAGAMNYLMGWYSIRMGRKYGSIALVAGGKHLQSDTYSTIGLVAGLLLLYFTKILWIDSLLALVFGTIIIVTGISILRKTIANLLDKADNEVLEEMVRTLTRNRRPDWVDIHNMKSIRYGSYLFVYCDLTLPWYYNIVQSHDAGDAVKQILLKEFKGKITVFTHSDPCKPEQCPHCQLDDCPERQAPFVSPLRFTLKEFTQSDEERNE